MRRAAAFPGALGVVALLIGAQVAEGHFLFIRLRPPAEGGRHAEVYFSDDPNKGDAQFVDKIASTKLWLQAKPGAFEPLVVRKTPDRLRALIPAGGTLSVIGECTYGVLSRPKQSPFLLRHYPKAVSGRADEIGSLQAKPGIPLEILVRSKASGLEFTALRDGKPAAGAEFSAIDADLKETKFTANSDGVAAWTPKNAGYHAVYTSRKLKAAGTHAGQKYEEIREFATLAFAWPLEAKGADPKAVALFQEALAARASWSDFPGFSAHIRATVDGRTWKGTTAISAKGDVALEKEDDVAAEWIRDQLESLAMHRMARAQDKAPVLRFADDERDHPLGRLLIFDGGTFASSYRVKDQQIMVVNRAMGKSNMTITILENDRSADKKFLPRAYTVQFWNAHTSELQRCETIQNRWTRLGSWDLPTELTMITSSAVGQTVKTMSLSQHRLLSGER